jgi:hypothetical protein
VAGTIILLQAIHAAGEKNHYGALYLSGNDYLSNK